MDTKKNRKEKLQEMTRKAIQEAVINVMAERGLQGLTMERVAGEAEVAKGTIYQYYENKEELMRDTINGCFMPLIEKAKEIFETDLEPDEKLSKLITAHYTFFSENQSLFKMLLVDHQVARASAEKRSNKHYQEIIRRLSELIQEGINKDIFREVDTQAAAVMLMEGNIQLTCYFLQSQDSDDLSSKGSEPILKKIFFKGILKE